MAAGGEGRKGDKGGKLTHRTIEMVLMKTSSISQRSERKQQISFFVLHLLLSSLLGSPSLNNHRNFSEAPKVQVVWSFVCSFNLIQTHVYITYAVKSQALFMNQIRRNLCSWISLLVYFKLDSKIYKWTNWQKHFTNRNEEAFTFMETWKHTSSSESSALQLEKYV